MSRKQLLGSIGWENMRRNSRPSTSRPISAHVGFDAGERRVVAFAPGEREQLRRVLQARVDPLHGVDGLLEGAAFLAELLRLLRVVPDLRVLEGAYDLDQARLLRVVVKDTSESPPNARRGPGGCSG
jgi:hypothetical protein